MPHKPCERCWWGRHVGLPLWMCPTRTVVTMGFCHANWYIMEKTPMYGHQNFCHSTLMPSMIKSHHLLISSYEARRTLDCANFVTIATAHCSTSWMVVTIHFKTEDTVGTTTKLWGRLHLVWHPTSKKQTQEKAQHKSSTTSSQQLHSIQLMEQPTEIQSCHIQRPKQKTYGHIF